MTLERVVDVYAVFAATCRHGSQYGQKQGVECKRREARRRRGIGSQRLDWVVPPLAERGVVVLVAPIGSDEFIKGWVRKNLVGQQVLLDRIPAMQDLQSAWLVLLLCVSARANYVLRNLPPEQVSPYAAEHDASTWACLCSIVGRDVADPVAREVTGLPFCVSHSIRDRSD